MKNGMAYYLIFTFIASPLIADEIVIQSFDHNGDISFNEVPDAMSYRIEWAPAVDGGIWTNFSGDLGVWMDNIPADGSGVITASVPMVYRIVASVSPTGMVYIPSGSFMMGNATNIFPVEEGDADELPQHEVYIDAFYIDKYEVTRAKWISVRLMSDVHYGYYYSNPVLTNPSDLPVNYLSWYDAVKWCNARSQIEGLTPVYYTDENFTNIYKVGDVIPYPDWTANGYRLPTEAEWEKASRGGQSDFRFPWSDYTNKISHAKANYYGLGSYYPYDLSVGSHPSYGWSLSPVGSFPPNGYGVFDMAGNSWEWCWDWYDGDYYNISPVSNPRGPATGTYRVRRGSNFEEYSFSSRCSDRSIFLPGFEYYELYFSMGFRCVRKP